MIRIQVFVIVISGVRQEVNGFAIEPFERAHLNSQTGAFPLSAPRGQHNLMTWSYPQICISGRILNLWRTKAKNKKPTQFQTVFKILIELLDAFVRQA